MKVVSVTVNTRTPHQAADAVDAALVDLRPLQGKAIVMDDASRDDSLDVLRTAGRERGWGDDVVVVESGPHSGHGAATNDAFRHAMQGDEAPRYVYRLDAEVRPDPGCIRTLVDFMDAHGQVGMAGSLVRYRDGSLRHCAFRFPGVLSEVEQGLRSTVASWLLRRWAVTVPPPPQTGPVDWVRGDSVLMRTQMLQEVGLFDEGFQRSFEEADLSYRALFAGWPTYYVVEAQAEHQGDPTAPREDLDHPRPDAWFESRRYYLRKNHGPITLWAANGAFVGASALYQLRRRLLGRPDRDPPGLLQDFVRHNFSRKRS